MTLRKRVREKKTIRRKFTHGESAKLTSEKKENRLPQTKKFWKKWKINKKEVINEKQKVMSQPNFKKFVNLNNFKIM